MRTRFLGAVVVGALAVLLIWVVLLPDDWRAWLGFSSQATQNYAFVSGVGPMFLTALLGAGAIGGLLHAVNCHREGCWRIGRHKVKGTPWCNSHHEDARSVETLEDKLDRLIDLLTAQAAKKR